MKLSKLKIGDTITHYCCGIIVIGTIVERSTNKIKTAHEPIRWGNDIYCSTTISESTPLQKPINPVTPAAWFNGEPIII